jgi:excisionase family DNA binding protein
MSDEPLAPIEELAKKFSVSVSTVRAWVRHGYIPAHTYVKIGATYRFDVARVMEALMTPKPETTPEPEPAKPEDPVQLELPFNNPDEDL